MEDVSGRPARQGAFQTPKQGQRRDRSEAIRSAARFSIKREEAGPQSARPPNESITELLRATRPAQHREVVEDSSPDNSTRASEGSLTEASDDETGGAVSHHDADRPAATEPPPETPAAAQRLFLDSHVKLGSTTRKMSSARRRTPVRGELTFDHSVDPNTRPELALRTR